MANSTYYVYAAEDDHRFLGKISVGPRGASSVDALINMARKKFKVKSLRIESTRRDYRPPVGRIKVQPMASRTSW